ncbi:hypothetical protein AGMMS4952_09390 [Spirochaetia bacterium]|nr:hypothetical protein AGMMS4952_09390 [Spirochaetia bacterium]
MITSWRLKNFKSIKDLPDLKMAPLTILTGVNSSGKSSLLQSIRLISQTMMKKDDKYDLDHNKSVPIVFNGHLINLGRFEDVVTNNIIEKKNSIGIGFTCNSSPELFSCSLKSYIQTQLHIDLFSDKYLDKHYWDWGNTDIDIAFGFEDRKQKTLRLFSSKLTAATQFDSNVFISTNYTPDNEIKGNDGSEYSLSEQKRKKPLDPYYLEATKYKTAADDNWTMLESGYQNRTLTGCQFKHFLPYKTIYIVNEIDKYTRIVTEILCNNNIERISDWKYELQSFKDSELEFLQKMYFPATIIKVMREILDGIVDFDELFGEKIYKTESSRDALNISDWINIVNAQNIEERTIDAFCNNINVSDDNNNLYKRIYDAANKALIESGRKIKTPNIITFNLQENKSYDFDYGLDYLEEFFSSKIKYLGPLRDPPKSVYPLVDFDDPKDVGIIGENVAAVFDSYKDTPIDYIPPKNIQTGKKIKSTLKNAVKVWLRYLGVANGVKTENKGKYGFTLSVKMSDSETFHDFTNVGVGVSQVFPIMVMCLIADKDTTFLFEQPELHLHPRVQSH